MLSSAANPAPHVQEPLPLSDLDAILVAQLAIAWAGEGGEEPRLGWWRTDLVSEFGGEDLFQRLLPHTWKWAVLQAVREAARRRDAELRHQSHDADTVLSLYSLGFEVDERVEERLQELKRTRPDPMMALPGLQEVVTEGWARASFGEWVQGHGTVDFVTAPIGRRLRGDPPSSPGLLVKKLVAACWPLGDGYPLPHYRVAR